MLDVLFIYLFILKYFLLMRAIKENEICIWVYGAV
jgi:hypothetical protein